MPSTSDQTGVANPLESFEPLAWTGIVASLAAE
jgi:hypothetical protein